MSLFQTTADQQFNSFQNPWNPMNSNPGGWGIDPNYLTPNYAAPYRPAYQGPYGGENTASGYGYGMGQSAWNLFSPFAAAKPMYGDTVQQEDPYYNSAYRAPDSAMWAGQRIALPALSYYAGLKATNFKVAASNPFSSGIKVAGTQFFGGSAESIARAGRTQAFSTMVGDRIGQGFARGMVRGAGLSTSSVGATAFARTAGMIGGMTTGLAMPLLAGEAITQAGEAAFIDPYLATARTERNLRENFHGIHGGDSAMSGAVHGFGMSREYASNLAGRLTKSSIKDMTFGTDDMSTITDLAARSGMLDDANLEKVEGKIKTIAKQLKVMMRVANEPDFKAAMEMMAELKVAGVSERTMGRVMQNLSGSAAVAGVSMQKLMNTVGAQGQYMYQANNLTPYLGQVNAANTYSAFAAAYRQGLIDPSTMAKFGGMEGATQLAMQAQVAAGETPYNKIAMMNQYFGGGAGGSVVENVSKFGQTAARDPLATRGAMKMYGHEMMSKQLMDGQYDSLLNQIDHISSYIPGMKNKDGSVDVEKAFLIATEQMGLDEMSAKAALKELYAYHDPKTRNAMSSALQGNMVRDATKSQDQAGLGNGILNPLTYGASKFWKEQKARGSDTVSAFREGPGAVVDWLQGKVHEINYGELGSLENPTSIDDMLGGDRKVTQTYKLERSWGQAIKETAGDWSDRTALFIPQALGYMKKTNDQKKFYNEINLAAQNGDQDALSIVNPGASKEERAAALDKLNMKKKLGGERLNKDQIEELNNSLDSANRTEAKTTRGGQTERMRDGLNKGLGLEGKSSLEGLSILDASRRISDGTYNDDDFDVLKKAYGDKSFTELADQADKNIVETARTGTVHMSAALTGHSLKDIRSGAEKGDAKLFGDQAKEVKKRVAEIQASDASEDEKQKQIDDIATSALMINTKTTTKSLVDKNNLPGGVEAKSILESTNSAYETARQQQDLNYKGSQHLINFDTKYSAEAAMGLGKSVGEFGDHVKAFGEAVQLINNKSNDPLKPVEAPSLFGNFWGGNNKHG